MKKHIVYVAGALSVAAFHAFGGAVTSLWGERFEHRGDGVWQVSTNVTQTTGIRIESTHAELLSGRAVGVRRLAVDVDPDGVMTTNVVIRRSDGVLEDEYVICPTHPMIHRVRQGGLVLCEEEGESGVQYSYDAVGRIGLVENYRTSNLDHMWTKECRRYTRAGDLCAVERVLDDAGRCFITTYCYDVWGNKVSASNSVGNVECAKYDPFGHILEISGSVTPAQFEYDSQGRLVAMRTTRDGLAWDETRWIYDAKTGKCLSKVFADGSRILMQYTSDGLLARVEQPDGSWRAYDYDGFHHLSRTRYSSNETPCFSRENDPLGHIRRVRGSNGYSASLDYGSNGVLVAETTLWGCTNTVERSRDRYGRVNGVIHSRNGEHMSRLHYGYSDDGYIDRISITNAFGNALALSYLTFAGRVMSMTRRSGTDMVTEEYQRDLYRPELVVGMIGSFNHSVAFCVTNEYDVAGRALKAGEWLYSYDTRNQLVAATMNGISCAYGYDCAGNITRMSIGDRDKSFGYNALNQLVSITDTNGMIVCRYDAAGNLLSDGQCRFDWDGENRLVCVRPEAPLENSLSIENEYDYKGRRIRKVVRKYANGVWLVECVSEMTYDGSNIIHERRSDASGRVEDVEFFWGASVADLRMACGGAGSLIAVSVNGEYFVPRYDNNMNIVAFFTTSGIPAVSRVFSPTGMLLEETGVMAGRIPLGFGTKYYDYESGIVYYENRCYAPRYGRWLSRDKAEEAGGRNLYCFVANRFGSCSDTTGMFSWSTIVIALIEGAGLVLDRTPVSNFMDDTVIDSYGGPEGFMNATESELLSRGGSLPRDMFAKARARNSKAVKPGATGLEGSLHSQLRSQILGSAIYRQKKDFIIRRLGEGTLHKGFVNIDFQDAGEDALGYAIGGAQLHYDYDKSSCSVKFTLEDTYDFTNKGHMWGRLEQKGFLVTYPVNVDIEAVKKVKAK